MLLLLCAITIVHADINGVYNNGCPKDTSIEKLLPHENCDQYYQCFHGALIARFCPSGLHFNNKLQKCDWTADVNCDEKQEEDNKLPEPTQGLDYGNPSHASLICASADSNGALVAHENCNQFYKCSFGKPIVLTCATNLLFNYVTAKCDSPNKVDCDDRAKNGDGNYDVTKVDVLRGSRSNAIVRGNSDPSQALTLCAAPGSDGVLVAHENCNQFYKCFSGQPVALACPTNLFYNPSMEYCDWPRNVNCSDRKIPENEDSNENTENGGQSNESEESESSSHESDDDSTNADNAAPEARATCAAFKSDGILIAHENCNQFYKCSGGRPVTLDCPGILMFNPDKDFCDWPYNVDCGDRIKPANNGNEPDTNHNGNDNTTPEGQFVGNHSDPSEALNICASQDSDGVLVAHENCNQFYKCHDGRPVALTCPANLLYNPDKDYCDWPTHVECGNRVISEHESDENSIENENESSNGHGSGNNHSNPNDAPAICAAENSDGLLIAHENCNQYYKCFAGKPIVLFCQLNLLYNPSKEYCDWAHNVDCGNRVLPGHENNNSGEGSDNSNVVTKLCSNSPEGDIIPHENCSQFYKCYSGKSYPMDCPPGLYFNPTNKVCDWPTNVQCGDRIEVHSFNKHAIARRALKYL